MDRDDCRYTVRRVKTGATPYHQFGRYVMRGQTGKRRSFFKVLVHLGEHATADEALKSWPDEIARARSAGREAKATRLEEKLSNLQRLLKGDHDER